MQGLKFLTVVCDISADLAILKSCGQDFEGAYYGMYFLELADYCTRENNNEREVLKLLYQSLRALTVKSIPRRLVRALRNPAVVANGDSRGCRRAIFRKRRCMQSNLSQGRPWKSFTHLP